MNQMANKRRLMRRRAFCIVTLCVLIPLSLISCASPEEKRLQFFSKGKALFEQGDYTKAKLEFRNALQFAPKDTESGFMLGLIALREGDMKTAFGGFKRIEDENPEHGGARLELAKLYLLANQLDEAKERLDTLMAKNSEDVDTQLVYSAYLLASKEPERAVEVLEKLKNGNATTKQDLFLLLAGGYDKTGKEKEAEMTLLDGIEKNPKTLALYYTLTDKYVASGRLEEAKKLIEQAVSQNQDLPGLQLKLAALAWEKDGNTETAGILARYIDGKEKKEEAYIEASQFYVEREATEKAQELLEKGLMSNNGSFKLRFALSEIFTLQNREDDSRRILEECLSLSKDNAAPGILEAKNRLARIHLSAERQDEAEALLDAVLKESPKNVDANLFKGIILSRQGKYDKAIASLRTVVAEQPDRVEPYLELADAHMANQEQGLAIETLNKALNIAPGSLDVMKKLLSGYAIKKDKAAAVQLLQKMTRLFPKDASLQVALGDFYLESGERARADEVYKTLLEKNPDDPVGYLKISQTHLLHGEKQQALEMLRQGHARLPDDPALTLQLASALTEQKEYAEVETLSKALFAKKADDPLAYYIFGHLHEARGEKKKALASYTQASTLAPRWIDPLLNRALLHLRAGEHDQAITIFEQAFAMRPTDRMIYESLVNLHIAKANYSNAIEVYEKVLASNAQQWDVVNNLAFLLAEFGQSGQELEKAYDLANKAIEKAPGDAAIKDTLGWVLFKKGDYKTSLEYLESALADHSRPPAILFYHLGMALYKNGKATEARDRLKSALGGEGDYPGRREAETVLAKLS